MINRVKKLLPPETLKLLYYSFIQPHLQYGLTLWGGCSNQNKKRVIAIQKRSIRTVCKAYFNSHTEPRMKKIGLLKFEDLYKQQCLVNMHDCVHEIAPRPISNLVQLGSSVSRFNLRSNSLNPLNVITPITKSRISSQSFSAKGPAFWNPLPSEIKSIIRKLSFKNRVKTDILNNYQTTSECNNPRCLDKRHNHKLVLKLVGLRNEFRNLFRLGTNPSFISLSLSIINYIQYPINTPPTLCSAEPF